MKLAEWQKLIDILQNNAHNISEDILKDQDEIKAIGEIALLQRRLEKFMRENFDE